jgi:hypothetical protein
MYAADSMPFIFVPLLKVRMLDSELDLELDLEVTLTRDITITLIKGYKTGKNKCRNCELVSRGEVAANKIRSKEDRASNMCLDQQ